MIFLCYAFISIIDLCFTNMSFQVAPHMSLHAAAVQTEISSLLRWSEGISYRADTHKQEEKAIRPNNIKATSTNVIYVALKAIQEHIVTEC